MVLHTWNQKLEAHAHVHAVVAGSGPAIDGSGIDGSGIAVAMRANDPATVGNYLVDAEILRDSFRDVLCERDEKIFVQLSVYLVVR